MPWWVRKSEAQRPTIPPPTTRTGTCVEDGEDIVPKFMVEVGVDQERAVGGVDVGEAEIVRLNGVITPSEVTPTNIIN